MTGRRIQCRRDVPTPDAPGVETGTQRDPRRPLPTERLSRVRPSGPLLARTGVVGPIPPVTVTPVSPNSAPDPGPTRRVPDVSGKPVDPIGSYRKKH